MEDGGHLTQRPPVEVLGGQPDELVVVELVGVVGRLVGRYVGVEEQAAGGLGSGAVRQLLETDQQGGLVPADRGDGELGPGCVGSARALGADRRTDHEAAVRLIGADLDGDLAADPVGLPIRPITTSMVSTRSG